MIVDFRLLIVNLMFDVAFGNHQSAIFNQQFPGGLFLWPDLTLLVTE